MEFYKENREQEKAGSNNQVKKKKFVEHELHKTVYNNHYVKLLAQKEVKTNTKKLMAQKEVKTNTKKLVEGIRHQSKYKRNCVTERNYDANNMEGIP